MAGGTRSSEHMEAPQRGKTWVGVPAPGLVSPPVIALCLSFLGCKTGITLVPTSLGVVMGHAVPGMQSTPKIE